MKTCNNCKSLFVQVQLSSIVRGYALIDVFRFLVLLGPMLSLFYACTNLHPTPPHGVVGGAKHDTTRVDIILYEGNRSTLSHTEAKMLANVENSCTRGYRDALPTLWKDARSTLNKGLHLEGIAMILPTTSATIFLTFQKKDLGSTLVAVIHFSLEALSVILSFFGAYFISDKRLCFLGTFAPTLDVPILLWTLNIFFAIVYKIGIVYSIKLYLKNHCKPQTFLYHAPTPEEELKIYLEELKSLKITPKTRFDIPEDPHKRDWEYCKVSIKKILHDVRKQIAELHRDDPMVEDILKSGRLQSPIKRPRSSRYNHSSTSVGTMGSTGPSVLRIAKAMASKDTEYTLLKKHHRKPTTESVASRDDVEIILPEPGFRYDPDQ